MDKRQEKVEKGKKKMFNLKEKRGKVKPENKVHIHQKL